MEDSTKPSSYFNERSFLQPLLLSEYKGKNLNCKFKTGNSKKANDDDVTSCLICDEKYDIINNQKEFLAHLLIQHKIVIADVKLIGDFKSYVAYWTGRLKQCKLDEICFKITTNSLPSDKGEKDDYYLLCDSLPEEKELRENLKMFRLEQALKQQDVERNEQNYHCECFFCSRTVGINKSTILNHLLTEHNFNIGLADNIVYFDEFYTSLKNRFDSLKCFYCDKIFYDKQVLKEHMRKKQHKCINPNDKEYDRFYIINYLEIGKGWQDLKGERDIDNEIDNNEQTIEDWDETFQIFYCLFCDLSFENENDILDHMNKSHYFDLKSIIQSRNLSFYSQVKLINYIRRQMYINRCFICQHQFETKDQLETHLATDEHSKEFPKTELFDQPEYLFSTFEDDNLLCLLDDNGYSKDEEKIKVIPEEYNTSMDQQLINDIKQIL